MPLPGVTLTSHVSCCNTVAEEIISPVYLGLVRALGADVRVIDWIPRTQYTVAIPGGKDSFWGYSLNRLV